MGVVEDKVFDALIGAFAQGTETKDPTCVEDIQQFAYRGLGLKLDEVSAENVFFRFIGFKHIENEEMVFATVVNDPEMFSDLLVVNAAAMDSVNSYARNVMGIHLTEGQLDRIYKRLAARRGRE